VVVFDTTLLDMRTSMPVYAVLTRVEVCGCRAHALFVFMKHFLPENSSHHFLFFPTGHFIRVRLF
jgi:hypothetical protein